MANILFIAKGTGGDLVPFPKIGQRLKEHGHHVTLLSHCSYAALAEQNGWDFAALDTPEQRQQIIDDGQLLNSPSGYPTYFRRHVFPRVAAEYEAIRARYVPGETVLVTTHKACLTPLLAAEKLGIPLVRLFATVSELITLPLMEGMYQSVLAENLNNARESIGLPPIENWNAWLRKADRELALWPDWFAAPDGDWVVRAVPVGFIQETGEDLSVGLLETLKGAEAPILITAGTGLFTDPRFYTASAEACRQLNRRGILVTRYPQLVPNDLPEQVQHYEYLPFASLMPHVAAVVHHGGVGSLACALAAGVPQLVLAVGGDRPENGERIQRLGVGEFLLPSRWEAGSIAAALERLLTSASVRENCQAFALRLHADDAAAETCKWIERVLPNSGAATAPPAPKATAAELMRKLSPEKQALLAQRLKEKRQHSRTQTSFRQPRNPGANAFPLSFAQERLWILDQLAILDSPSGQALAYNTNMALRLSGPLDRAVLERAFNEVVRRHEVLRTTFNLVDGQALQTIAPALTIPLTEKDLQSLPPSEREPEALRLVDVEARQALDLARGPLLRTTLLRLDETNHVLLLTVHHIVSDDWSMWILVWEMATLYRAFLAGEDSPLPELPAQYADFSVWQREWLQGEVLEQQLAFWKRRLAGAPQALDLPMDHPRPVLQSARGAEQNFALSKPLTETLKALGQATGATLFMTLLAIFKILLQRYTAQADIVVGTPMVDRNRTETEGLIGFFLNTLALRTDLSGDPTFRELLKRVQETAVETFAHRHLPFEKLVAELQPVRDTSRSPIFQVMFNFLNTPKEMVNVPGLSLEPFGGSHVKAQFDLTVSIVETQLGLRGAFIYNTDLFEAHTIARMMAHFQTLAESVAADPDQRISDLQWLTNAEREQVLEAWNATEAEFPREKCIHQLFEAQVARTPEAIAIVFEQQQLTYQALNQRANQMARYLQKLGVGPEVLVGVCLERSLEMVVGLLGILKAGGAYVPLDPTYPPERLAFMLADSGISVLLTQENLLAGLPACNARLVLENAWSLIAQESVEDLPGAPAPSNLAYVIYTSGSTGKPKGVQIEHAALVNFLTSMRQQPGLTREDTLLSVTTLSFDIAGLELYLPLTTGARLILVSRDVATDGMALLDTLQSTGATVMQATPATWRMLISAGWQGSPSLKILCGGEALPVELAHQLVERCASLWNMYGPTETTVWSTVDRVESIDGPLSIGRPIANTLVYVLDAHLNPVPVGVPGELYIGGDGLARGYLNRPDLTAEKFVPSPFKTTDYRPQTTKKDGPSSTVHRLYRTGDLVRYRPDGKIEFLGRIDHQVKIHGFRIELGEIESALRQHPQVRQSVVIAREEAGIEKRLVAYLVVEGVPPTPQELRNFLKSRLPEYMLPTAIVFLEALPLTPNGKVDRKALPAPDGARPASASGWVAPRTPAEEQLAHIWAQVLRLKQVGVHDDFFELGGDSLLSLQVIALARQVGLHLTPRQIFQYRTIAELAAASPTPELYAKQDMVTGPVPIMPMLMLDYVYRPPQAWWRAFEMLVEVPRMLRPAQLLEAMQHLIVHHDGLRLRLVKENADYRMFIVASEDGAFEERDLAGLSALEQDAVIETAREELWASLNFSTGPLFRIVFFDLGLQRLPRMLIVLHHFAVDAYSVGVVLNDFQIACQQLVMGEALKLPAKTTSIKVWAERMDAYLHSDSAKPEVAYWKSLPWARVRPTPVDHPEVSQSPYASLTGFLDKDETQALLSKVPAAYGVRLWDVLITACVLTYARYAQLQPLLILALHHGRDLTFDGLDLFRTVGNLYASYPLLLDIDLDLSLKNPEKVLKLVAEERMRVPHGGATWPWISYHSTEKFISLHENMKITPNIVFNYRGEMEAGTQTQSGMFRAIQKPADKAPMHLYDITGKSPHTCETIIEAGRFKVNWEYFSACDEQATIEGLIQEYLTILRSLIRTTG